MVIAISDSDAPGTQHNFAQSRLLSLQVLSLSCLQPLRSEWNGHQHTGMGQGASSCSSCVSFLKPAPQRKPGPIRDELSPCTGSTSNGASKTEQPPGELSAGVEAVEVAGSHAPGDAGRAGLNPAAASPASPVLPARPAVMEARAVRSSSQSPVAAALAAALAGKAEKIERKAADASAASAEAPPPQVQLLQAAGSQPKSGLGTAPHSSALTDMASTASTACTEKTQEAERSEEMDIDLGRLCAALGSFQRSSSQVALSGTPPPQSPPTQANLDFGKASSLQTPAPGIRASHVRQASDGNGVASRNSGSNTPSVASATGSNTGAQAAVARDAQRMDAWFQRVLAKGPEKVGNSSSSTASTAAGGSNAAGAAKLPEALLASTPASKRSLHEEPTLTTPSPSKQTPPLPETPAQRNGTAAAQPTVVGDNAIALDVSLDDTKLGTLVFRLGQDIEDVCQQFIQTHRLRPVFKGPLESHVELMVHMGKKHGAVDVVELL
eukprot:TRINITY_DN25791_c0_g1_i1.p1 TRINITY_DN25791_c0_g1~~TRINITY_DN25791_c0_g1_i1.p1  ORF type:complete len:495 (-),score=101.43 TRINITY_DN25791_c0_g1_i1:70-1554(-)